MTEQTKLRKFNTEQDLGKVVEGVWCKTLHNGDFHSGRCQVEGVMKISDFEEAVGRYAPKEATHYLLGEEMISFPHASSTIPGSTFGKLFFSGWDYSIGVTYLKLKSQGEK